MMDINKYILSQIKIDERLIKMVEQQAKHPTKIMKHESKQKPNNFLLDKINENIKNEKRLTAHYKSVATGKPVVQEDDNIRLISSNQKLDINLENQFNFLMSKYVKDQTILTTLLNGLQPNMLAELVHNFSYYEPQIRQYRGQYIDNKVFGDKLRNMLLKNVNLKYPATIPLNSAMDANPNKSDIIMQKAFEAKTQAVNEPIGEKEKNTTNNLQMIDNMIRWIGGTKPICSTIFELSTVVIELLKNYIDVVKFHKLGESLTKLSKADQNSFELLSADIEGIYTGNIYNTKNIEINAFIKNIKQQSQSFRTFLIKFAMEDYKRKFAIATDKTIFYKYFWEYFKKQTSVGLDPKPQAELKDNKFKELSNNQIIELIDEILPPCNCCRYRTSTSNNSR
jgi:hypothetical protein